MNNLVTAVVQGQDFLAKALKQILAVATVKLQSLADLFREERSHLVYVAQTCFWQKVIVTRV